MLAFSGEHKLRDFIDYINRHHPIHEDVQIAYLPDFKSFVMVNEDGEEVDVFWAGYEQRLNTIWIVGVPPETPQFTSVQRDNYFLLQIAKEYAKLIVSKNAENHVHKRNSLAVRIVKGFNQHSIKHVRKPDRDGFVVGLEADNEEECKTAPSIASQVSISNVGSEIAKKETEDELITC